MVAGSVTYPFHGTVSEVVGNFLPIFSATEGRCLNSEDVGNSMGREWGRTVKANPRGGVRRVRKAVGWGPAELPGSPCSPALLHSKRLTML